MESLISLKDRMQSIKKIINETNEEKFVALFRFLNERIENPENFVVFLGETSSGKTTLLNGLLQEQVFPTSARPTTGAVIELMDKDELPSNEYFAVNKDATLELLSEDLFMKLLKKPDSDLDRLRLVVPTFPYGLKNLRLFDTPGYGSLHEEHEQILKEFIPNSDVIVYVVSYRIGFKENDHHFMKFVEEIIDDNTAFYLVVNRVPEDVTLSDNRIQEIRQHAQDCLHRSLNCYLVPAQIVREDGKVLPNPTNLWNDLKVELDSQERMQALTRAFHHYQDDLLLEVKGDQEQKLAFAKASIEEVRELQQNLENFMQNEDTIKQKIKDTFQKLNSDLDKLFDNATENINESLIGEIEKANRWRSKDECVGLIQSHMLPMRIRKETKTISDYLQVELERLDDEINSLLNTAVKKFETQIALKAPVFQSFFFNLGNRMGQKMAGKALTQYFKQFGGAGGAGAGVANVAKKGLKTVGNLFGKTFTKETHNALAKFLSRVGATSAKAITAAAAVIVEGLFYLYDTYTWPKELGKQVKKATNEWKRETEVKVTKDIKELEEHNYQTIKAFFEEYHQSNITLEEDSYLVDKCELAARIKRIEDLLDSMKEEVQVNG